MPSEDPISGGRRRVSAVGRTRTEAMDSAKEKLLEAVKEDDPTKPDRMPTVAEWCTQWVEDVIRPRRSPNTYRAYETHIRCGITPAIGNVRLDRVRPSHARLLERKETEHNSGATARLAQTVLTRALDDAVREGIIDRNLLDGLEPPALEPRETLVLTPDQARRLIGVEPDPKWRLLWRLLFATGMRIGEALGLIPEEIVDVDRRTCIRVEWQLKRFPHVTDAKDMPRAYETRHVGGTVWLARPMRRDYACCSPGMRG
ncbi:tyrosine-type recombinase/integrase [Bifidobacterium callitrichos]|nr:hypothetical protein [Bifidobacterium callitrichos]